MKSYLTILILLIISIGATAQQSSKEVVVINASRHYQTIDNFGASDCWQAQHIAASASQQVKNRIADMLFSTELDASTGKPLGIGLSLWRFNIGAGSKEQGKQREFRDWAENGVSAVECFLNEDETYDWSKQSSERWFLRAAKSRGVSQFLAFAYSPPYFMSKNGKTHLNGVSTPEFNLDKANYGAYADFLVNSVKGLSAIEGIEFDYLAPFNEPEWEWKDGVQEGSPATNRQMADITRLIDAKLTALGGKRPKIVLCESAKYNALFSNYGDDQGSHIERLFNKNSSAYVGDLKNVDHTISGHSYWTTVPDSAMIATRSALRDALRKRDNLKFWQTEFCMLENDSLVGGPKPVDLSINFALFVAKVIHFDLTLAGASAWHWWLGMSTWDNKDGLVTLAGSLDGKNLHIRDNKLLWVMGNFSRFIRPGSVRVDVSSLTGVNTDNPKGLMISAYHDKSSDNLVVVAINYGERAESFKLNIDGLKVKSFTPYITSDKRGEDLAPREKIAVKKGGELDIPARSITTFVGKTR